MSANDVAALLRSLCAAIDRQRCVAALRPWPLRAAQVKASKKK